MKRVKTRRGGKKKHPRRAGTDKVPLVSLTWYLEELGFLKGPLRTSPKP